MFLQRSRQISDEFRFQMKTASVRRGMQTFSSRTFIYIHQNDKNHEFAS